MAETAVKPTDPANPAAQNSAGQAPPPARMGMKGKLLAVAFVLLIVLVECVVAILVFPSADDTHDMAQAMLAEGEEHKAHQESGEGLEEGDSHENREIDLGKFDASSYQPLSNTTLRISLHLYGMILPEDEHEVLALLEEKQQRMREQVLITLRSAEITDLTDAGLGLIKRKVLEKINRTLGKPLIQQVVFSEFAFFEQ